MGSMKFISCRCFVVFWHFCILHGSYIYCSYPGSDLFDFTFRSYDFCRFCSDDCSRVCVGGGSGRFSAVTDLIYADPFSEIQCRYKSGTGIYSSFFRIQHTGSSSYWKWFVKQCSFCASGRLWSNCLLFYSFSEGAA